MNTNKRTVMLVNRKIGKKCDGLATTDGCPTKIYHNALMGTSRLIGALDGLEAEGWRNCVRRWLTGACRKETEMCGVLL